MPYKIDPKNKKCVVKADTGTKVGCTKGSVKKYLTALRINESEEIEEFDWVKDIKLSLGFDDLKLGDVVRLKDYDNQIWEIIDIYMSDPNMTGKPSEKRIKFKTPFKNSHLELWKSPLNSNDYFELVNRNPDRVYFNVNESEEPEGSFNQINHEDLYTGLNVVVNGVDYTPIIKWVDEIGTVIYDYNGDTEEHSNSFLIAFDKWDGGHNGNGNPACDKNKCWSFYNDCQQNEDVDCSNIDKITFKTIDSYSLFDSLNESEDNEFDWVEDVVSDGINIGDLYKINLDYPIVGKVEDIIFDDSKRYIDTYVVKVRYFNDNEEEEWGDYLEEINIDWMYDLINDDDHHWVKVTKEYAEKLFKDYKYFNSPVGSEDKNVNESEEWYDDILNENPLIRFDDLKVGDIISLFKTNTFSNLNSEFNNLIQDDIYYHIDSFKDATTHRNGYAEKETVAVCSLMKENPDTGNYYGVSRETIDLVRGNNKPVWTLIYREGVMESINKSEDDFEWAEQLFNEPIKDVIEGQYYLTNINGRKIQIFIKKIYKDIVTFDALTYDTPRSDKPVLLRREIELDTPLGNAKRLVDSGYWMPIKKEDKMSNENINESEWFEDVVNEPIMLKVEELEMGDIVIPTCVKDGEYIVMAKGTSVRLLDAPTHWATLKRNVKTNTGGVYFEHDTEMGRNCRFKLINRENIIEESEEFDWVEDILSKSPLTFGDKEIMIDVSDLDDNEKIDLLYILEPYIDRDLDGSNSDSDWGWDCLIKNKNVKSLSLHCGIEDNDYKPQMGRVCCLSYVFGEKEEFNPESIIPIKGKGLLGLNINQQTNMNESEEEEFNWVDDIANTREIDITGNIDLWRNRLVEGSIIRIHGKWEDMGFSSDLATIVEVPDGAGNYLLKFDRVISEFENNEEGNHTHCGENETQNIKCECQRKKNNLDEVGKCWWTNLESMEEVLFYPFEGKQITESEEDEFKWAEDLLDFHTPINITDKLDIMEELPVGSILQVQGYQDEMYFDMEEVKLIDKAEDKDFTSTYYLFKLKYERVSSSEMTHCGNGQKNMKICECRDENENDEISQSEIGKCWWIELKKQDKVIYYPKRIDLFENKIKKPLLTEGRYDAITRKTVRDIMKVFTDGEVNNYNLPLDITGEYEYEQEGLAFSVELDIVRDESIDTFKVVTSIADDEENIIMLTIILGHDFNKTELEKLFYKLQEDIIHEIEHFTQIGTNRIEDRPIYKGNTANLKTTYGHHKNVLEIPALVRGFYRRAKLEKKPLDEIMMEDLDTEIERGNLTKYAAKKLLTIWVDYAKKNLPKAIYSN